MSQVKRTDFIERNNLKAFMAIARDWIFIFLIIAISMQINNIFVYVAAVWLIGIFQYSIGDVLLHEAVHHNLFTDKSWHEKLEFIYAFPFLRTFSSYKQHHFAHHKYLLGEGDYVPEEYEWLGLNNPHKNIFIDLIIKPILGWSIYAFIWCLYYDLITQNKSFEAGIKRNFKLGLFWLAVILGFFFSGNLNLLLLYWFVPLAWSNYCYSIWCEAEQHFNTVSGTRTNVNPIFNFLFHYGGYHYVHHLVPTIPWYKLPDAHYALCPDNHDISTGIWDTYRQLAEDKQSSTSADNWDELRAASLNT